MREHQRLEAFALIVVAAVGLAWLLSALGGLTGLRAFEDFTLDLRQQTTPESFQPGMGERESEIVLVLFDEYSVMDSVDGWDWISPFPRAHLAELVDALARARARTIGLDVYLDRMFPGLNNIDGGNDLLRGAIERAGNVILVAPVEQTDSGPVARPPHRFFADVAADVGSAELPSSFETFRDGALAVRSGNGLEPSFALAVYAHSRGVDVDSLLLEAKREGRIALRGLPERVGRVPPDWFGAAPGGDPEPDGGAEIGQAEDGGAPADRTIVPFRVRYVGPPSSSDASDPPGTFQAVPSSSVPLLTALSPELFRDRIVLLGTGFHAEDKFRTPFYGYSAPGRPAARDDVSARGDASARDDVPARGDASAPGDSPEPYGWMFGVEIHANALQNMLDGEYVEPLGPAARTLLLLLVALLTGGVAFRRGAAWGAAATLAAISAVLACAWWAWAGAVYVPGGELFGLPDRFVWMPVGAPVLAGLFSYVGSVAYVSIVEGREKRFIKGAFGKYLSPDVVAEISEHPEALQLGGQKRTLSLLFSDLSGFTTLSERMDAQDLVALLNEYLDDMTSVVLDAEGYLDKYIGDAIMAFWNAPKDVPDHADRALRAAIDMQRKMVELNAHRRAIDPAHGPLTVRIGVHTGEVVVGNVGGTDRFDYSAIGDAVNLAARLEPANKTYDTLNMTSEATLAAADPFAFRVRELDLIAVVGKAEPVKVYELLERSGIDLGPPKEQALERYAAGLAAYRCRDWKGAWRHFEQALEACPSDGPSRIYLGRCIEHIATPPPPDWDFVVRRTEK